jgi:hypothetical protein
LRRPRASGYISSRAEQKAQVMTGQKRIIHLSDDNWADGFSDAYPASLV